MIDSGIINLNKPKGMTSHDCVSAVRRIIGIRRVGHTGTLDPMAEGVLPICIGTAARIMEYLDIDYKTYRAEMTLGITTDTQDVWGKTVKEHTGSVPPLVQIAEAFEDFRGEIEQTPPKYSALKVNGKKLYEYARAGEEVEIKKRKVFIKDLQINTTELSGSKVSFDVTCSKGTYIRTICHDVGEMLGCGGAMSGLVRLASGVFKLEDAIYAEDLAKLAPDALKEVVKPADFPLVHFGKAVIKSRDRAIWFTNGGVLLADEVSVTQKPGHKEMYCVYGEPGIFLGVAIYDEVKKIFVVDKIFKRGAD